MASHFHFFPICFPFLSFPLLLVSLDKLTIRACHFFGVGGGGGIKHPIFFCWFTFNCFYGEEVGGQPCLPGN